MQRTCHAQPARYNEGASTPHRSAVRVALNAIAIAVSTLIARSRQRRALADLDTRLLADVGIDRRSAATEASKPLWRR